jgi:3-hydroxyisobutyrate dehydrogenase-like beta-hydroxyacid dehydrogenase
MVLAAKACVDPQRMVDIIGNTVARQELIAFKACYVLRRDFSTHFAVKWMGKDIRLAREMAEACQAPVPITAVIGQEHQATVARGFRVDDFSSVIRALEEIAGSR